MAAVPGGVVAGAIKEQARAARKASAGLSNAWMTADGYPLSQERRDDAQMRADARGAGRGKINCIFMDGRWGEGDSEADGGGSARRKWGRGTTVTARRRSMPPVRLPARRANQEAARGAWPLADPSRNGPLTDIMLAGSPSSFLRIAAVFRVTLSHRYAPNQDDARAEHTTCTSEYSARCME